MIYMLLAEKKNLSASILHSNVGPSVKNNLMIEIDLHMNGEWMHFAARWCSYDIQGLI